MGIFGAMTTAITGLRAQSVALEHISNNIANSQTLAYKRTDTSFAELLPESSPREQALGVVQAASRPTNTVQGDISNSEITTFSAINGDGYFIVGQQVGTSDGLPVFSDEDLFSRRGDFEIDKNGNLKNGAGYFLKGLPINAQTGNTSGSLPEIIQITNDFLAASATTEIDYRANLPSFPITSAQDDTVSNSELLDPVPADANFSNDPTVGGAEVVVGSDASTFIDRSVSGGAITVFDAGGQALSVQMRWGKTDSVANGGVDTWNLFYLTDATATGANTAWTNLGTNYIFGADGQLTPSVTTVTITGMTIEGNNIGDITLDHGANGITQFSDSNGLVKVTALEQNGFAAGERTAVSITDDGRVNVSYSNGQSVDLAQIVLASFFSDNDLQKLDGGTFRSTQESGTAIFSAQGNIVGRALENSNTDIADEFTKLIVTQQAYAANTRIVSTGDEMLQEALNMVR